MEIRGKETPRIYTPPLRALTPETTLGFEMIDFAENYLHVDLLPWERWWLIHAFEVIDTEDGGWMFRFWLVILLVGRQNGKTLLGSVVALFFLYVLKVKLVIGTSQDISNAEDTWQQAVEMAQDEKRLAKMINHVWYTNGAKRLQLSGKRNYRVKAANRKAGRGTTVDFALLDELREHQTWDAWAAMSKTITASANPMILGMSNAGDGTSVVLRHFRMIAHKMLGDPDGIVKAAGDSEPPAEEEIETGPESTVGFFEWSAPPDAELDDIDAWCQANPSLGYTIPLSRIRGFYKEDPADVFKTETLCQWVTSTATPPFPVEAWEAGKDENSEVAEGSPLFFGVDISADRTHASIGVCGKRADGEWHVELAEYRSGTGWLVTWFEKAAPNYKNGMKVALQSKGAPIASMADVLGAIDGVNIVECKGKDVAGWCGRLYDSVAASIKDSGIDAVPVHHITQPALDLAANIAATRPLGDGAWAWDRIRSQEDISPLVSVTMAFGLATQVEEIPKTYESVYNERGVLTV